MELILKLSGTLYIQTLLSGYCFTLQVYKAEWQGITVVYNRLQSVKYREDFRHGLSMLVKAQPHRNVTQLIGFCKDAFLTEYHPLGSANNVLQLLRGPLKAVDSLMTRLQLCINYVTALDFLHSGPLGTRIMCDSNDLHKTLSQFLLTSDLDLVINDLDALPEVGQGQLAKCGHVELTGDFVAVEQLWPYDDPFNDNLMPGYNEKSDIWKIPDICDSFIGDIPGSESLKFHLFQVHKLAKSREPSERPSARVILDIYREIKKLFEREL